MLPNFPEAGCQSLTLAEPDEGGVGGNDADVGYAARGWHGLSDAAVTYGRLFGVPGPYLL
ncbi:hypothetical protein GCM10009603_14610 [Nocardiopsis exhalans]